MSRLLKDSPPWLHFVISGAGVHRWSSHGSPEWERSRRSQQTTCASQIDETEFLFADGYGMPLDADVLVDVGVRTKGWAASLQLFHGSVRGRPSSAVRALAKSLSGASEPDIRLLAQEVLKNVHGELEEFLIRASLLNSITAERTVALFSDRRGVGLDLAQAHAWISECDRLGLLSRTSEASETRHLHPLLRDFLERALNSTTRSGFHPCDALGRCPRDGKN